MSDLPPRYHQETRLRKVEKQARSIGGGPNGISEAAFTVEDDAERVRVVLGLLSTGEYGIEVYDSAGVLRHRYASN